MVDLVRLLSVGGAVSGSGEGERTELVGFFRSSGGGKGIPPVVH